MPNFFFCFLLWLVCLILTPPDCCFTIYGCTLLVVRLSLVFAFLAAQNSSLVVDVDSSLSPLPHTKFLIILLFIVSFHIRTFHIYVHTILVSQHSMLVPFIVSTWMFVSISTKFTLNLCMISTISKKTFHKISPENLTWLITSDCRSLVCDTFVFFEFLQEEK